jgi:hypothetical protein
MADRRLIDAGLVRNVLTRAAPWCGSHGAEDGYLGFGLLYYALVYAARARVAVCLGSGGGFVPRVMRQAQRDLGIAHRSRTILVDGNVPEAGWGAPAWMAPDSFFRVQFPDVELVLRTTRQAAAEFFAPNGIRIDYLHIDADHSFEACLADFETYRRFLQAGAVVTLHDTNFPGAGVCHVVEHLRGRTDCEVIDFSDRGAGTAVVRVLTAGVAAPAVADGCDPPVRVTVRADRPVYEPPARDWRYLLTEPFELRNVLAAHLVRKCRQVVEIGGWRSPIDRYLTGAHESVVVVDPFIRDHARGELNGRPCEVRHVRARFQDLHWQIVHPREYGLVMLGLDIGVDGEDERVLQDLVAGAAVTVVEFATSWTPARELVERLLNHVRVRRRLHAGLDLSANEFGDLIGSWPPRTDRELVVLEPAA